MRLRPTNALLLVFLALAPLLSGCCLTVPDLKDALDGKLVERELSLAPTAKVPANVFGVVPDSYTLTQSGKPISMQSLVPSALTVSALAQPTGFDHTPLEKAIIAQLQALSADALNTAQAAALGDANSPLSFSDLSIPEPALRSYVAEMSKELIRASGNAATHGGSSNNSIVTESTSAKSYLRALTTYYSMYFSNKYRDRNGVNTQFDRKQAADSAESLLKAIRSREVSDAEVSTELAGQIFYVLVDYLGDSFAGIPFYAEEIYADAKLKKKLEAEIGTNVLDPSFDAFLADPNTNEAAITAKIKKLESGELIVPENNQNPGGSLSQRLTDLNNYTGDAVLKSRRKVELVERYMDRFDQLVPVYARLLRVQIHKSKAQRSFPCHRGGLIPKHFGPFGGEEVLCNGQAGADYSRLVARLIAAAAKQAEKQTKTAVGGVVRGISWASLDNEVVAEILATVGGGIAKKITEYVTYKVLVKVITDPTIDLEITIGGTKYKKKQFLDWLAEQDL